MFRRSLLGLQVVSAQFPCITTAFLTFLIMCIILLFFFFFLHHSCTSIETKPGSFSALFKNSNFDNKIPYFRKIKDSIFSKHLNIPICMSSSVINSTNIDEVNAQRHSYSLDSLTREVDRCVNYTNIHT